MQVVVKIEESGLASRINGAAMKVKLSQLTETPCMSDNISINPSAGLFAKAYWIRSRTDCCVSGEKIGLGVVSCTAGRIYLQSEKTAKWILDLIGEWPINVGVFGCL